MAPIGRLITAMVTPFDSDGQVDFAQAKALALALLESGSDGLVLSGTTGESPTLTSQEKLKLFSEIKSAVGDRGSVIAGVGTNDTAASIELARGAETAGVDGLLLVVPYYNKPTQEGLRRHFTAIAEATRLPCILYNVPSRTVANLAADTVVRLSQIRNIVGVKEASGDLEQIGAIIDGVDRSDFLVWSGNDSDTIAIIERGGYGVVSVVSHLVGRQIKAMIDHCVRGDSAQARAAHDHLEPLFRDLFVVSNPIPLKHALNQLGFPVGGYRLPLCEPDAASASQVMATVGRYTIDLPIPAAANR
ncbi:MAG: 4-hydroxy-tetrahydrodipicolinate synthase [Chloroflexi bacterium]|nr:4-hydroxy-tetrahydrodipicolinate synthase [Chloroflexota bacterium]